MKPVVLSGATGYTGQLVARALADSGRPFILAGRDPVKVAELAEALGGAPTLPGDLGDPAAVAGLVAAGSQVLNCVGPFDLWSFPLAEACARAGVDYLDVTGELPFVARSREALHGLAQASGARLLHSCAFESLLSDLLAATLDEPTDPSVAIRSYYRFAHPGMSPGTRLTARLTKGRPRLLLAEGQLRGATREELSRPADFAGEDAAAVLSPYPETLFFAWARGVSDAASHTVVRAGDVGFMIASVDAEAPDTAQVLARHAKRRARGPSDAERTEQGFDLWVQAEARSGATRRASLHGVDPYGLTATLLLMASRHLAERPSEGGVLAPTQVLPVQACLAELEAEGLRRVGPGAPV